MKFGSSKKDNDVTHAQKVTVLSLGFELTGDVISKNDIRADGILRGHIRTDKRVVVGEKASITGDILADEISISGEVVGDLYINGETTIHATAKVSGNIITHKITIQTGAEINSCIRTADPAAIQKEKEGLHLIATPKLEKKFPPTPTEQKRREDPNPELVGRAVPEVKKARIEEIVPPVSTNFRSW
ncbi:MAG TPA: polymer-forming cytoskeletal protein [Cyclobacteriaceae bacterium]|nr:polymer-forming cytoskeletal protein [Cyclobacteriaceae bacterium]